jgi:hypothetical protein
MKKIYLFLYITFSVMSANAQPHVHAQISHEGIDSIVNTVKNYFVKLKSLPKGRVWTFGDKTIGTEGKITNGKIYSFTLDTTSYTGDFTMMPMLTIYVRANNPKTKYFPVQVTIFSYDKKTGDGYLTSHTLGKLGSDNESSQLVFEKDPNKVREIFYNLLGRLDEML